MMDGFLDRLGRVVMLVLAGMVTLSIIGSIAAIPSGSIETRIGLETEPQIGEPPTPVPQPETEAPAPQAEPEEEAVGEGTPGMAGAVPAPRPTDAERWLEAITYALLALVGVAALASLLLWRGLRERRRIADALEALAARP
jgi:hypothetical protein